MSGARLKEPVVGGHRRPTLRVGAGTGHRAEATWLAIVSGRDRRLRAALARLALLSLSWLYGAVVETYRALYAWGILRTTTLPCCVIGVGNLTVGGTGKSTTVRWLARRLSQSGCRVAVLSYGYQPKKTALGARRSALGRDDAALTVRRAPSADRRVPTRAERGKGAEATLVVSDGRRVLVPTARSGDESRMLADALPGVPVLIGPRRVASGARAVEEFGAEVCVLDDAFQYWRLRKDLEIVLIDASAPLGYGYLLPRGLLRESARSLRRADVVLLMNGFRLPAEQRARLLRELVRRAPRALLLEGRHRPTELSELFTGELRPLAWLNGRRVAALSSLGNPDGFEQTLRELGASDVVPRRFPDHHRYTTEEAIASCELALRGSREAPPGKCAGAPPGPLPVEAVVTTAKDAPKLREVLGIESDGETGRPCPVGSVPVLVLEIDLDLGVGEDALLERVLRQLRKRDRDTPSTNQAD